MFIQPIFAKPPAAGGGTGPFTFAIESSTFDYGTGPSDTVYPAEGNQMFATMQERSGLGHSSHAISDDNSGVWTKIASFDQEIADGNARHSLSVWTKTATAADELGVILSGSVGGSDCALGYVEISCDKAFSYTVDDTAAAHSGTGDWDGTGSGNASASGPDRLVMAVGGCRNSSDEPTAVTLTGVAASQVNDYRADNQCSTVISILTASQSSGNYSATVDSDGTGNEGGVIALVFEE